MRPEEIASPASRCFQPSIGGRCFLERTACRHSFDRKASSIEARKTRSPRHENRIQPPPQLADPDIAGSDKILRRLRALGFCTATCPTMCCSGDELDSPRGRLYLIKEMLEKDRPPTQEVVTHIDRCLSCLACMTNCPSA